MNNKKKHNNSGTDSTPSSKASRLSTQCWGITGRNPAHGIAQLHRRLAPHFLTFLGPKFPIFFIIHPRKKKSNQNDVEFDFSIGHALVVFQFF